MITSLLSLKAIYFDSEEISVFVNEIEYRIIPMALAYDMLYESASLVDLEINEFLHALVARYLSYESEKIKKISIEIKDLESFVISIDAIIPFGIILVELLLNSIKHGFPQEETGKIVIETRKIDDRGIEIIYSDNGIGLSKDINIIDPKTLGIQFILGIVKDQLHGTIEFFDRPGFRCRITFPYKGYESRI